MSRIPDLGSNNKHLLDILDEYDSACETVEEHLTLRGKTLEVANKENPAWQLYYDQRRLELFTLTKYFENEVKRVQSKLFRSYKENQGRNIELNDREMMRWIESEPALLNMKGLLLEVQEVHQKYEAINKAFQSRGYALNNITRARVSEVHDVLL